MYIFAGVMEPNLYITNLGNIPVVADLCYWYGSSGASTAEKRYVHGL